MRLLVIVLTIVWFASLHWTLNLRSGLSPSRNHAAPTAEISPPLTDDTKWISSKPSQSFRTKEFEIATARHSSDTAKIQVREIDDSNKHLIPSFEKVGFQFIDITKLLSMQRGSINLMDYHNALRDVVRCDNRCKLHPIFKVIVSDLSYLHGLAFRMGTTYTLCRDNSKKNTHIHFDLTGEGSKLQTLAANQIFKSPGHFRLWIPLHDIDNWSLGVGDTSALRDRSCANLPAERRSTCLEDFNKVLWYHQRVMRRQDVILLANGRVPHFSINRRERGLQTQNRSAFTIDLHVSLLDIALNSLGKQTYIYI